MKAKTHGKRAKQRGFHWQPPRGYYAVWAAVLVSAVAVALINLQFSNKALPGVYVGNVAVQGMAEPELRKIIETQKSELKVVFQEGDTSVTVPAADIGMTVDVDATVEQALRARRSPDTLRNLQVWRTQSIPLAYHNDAGMLKAYIAERFPHLFVDPQDARLVFNEATQQFDVQPGVPGKGFDIRRFEQALPDLARNPRMVVLPVATLPVEPLIGDAAAAKAQTAINEQIKTKLEFLHLGKVAYSAQPADIAKWVHFMPDTTTGTLTPEFDKAKIEQFIKDKVGGKITQLPLDRKVIVDKNTGEEHVLTPGRKGYQIKETDVLAAEVLAAVSSRQALTRDVAVVEAPFKTVTIAGSGKWLEIDLSRQMLFAYLDNQLVDSFLISSGKAATPTQIGEGRIYKKFPMQTMTGTINGEYYYVPNIKWVSYFNGGEAIHGTYWHSNFGTPMSHGCINMTEAAAKFIYDFAPIGTKVIVHR